MDIEALCRRFEAARAERANFNATWQDIADRVWPAMSDFTSTQAQGANRTEKMLDSTAALASERALAAITSFFWPSNQQYQRLTSVMPKSATVKAVEEYLDKQRDTLFRVRYSPRAAFEAQMSEVGRSFLVFGTGILFIDDMLANPAIGQPGILYKALPLSQCYLQENAAGKIDTLHRCWSWTLRQVNQRFPDKLPPDLMRKLEKNPDERIELTQTVMPRREYELGGLGGRNMPWASVYYLADKKISLDEGGFRTWPFAVMRYMTSPGEVYGRSPAWMAMPNIRTLNEMKRTVLVAAQKVGDPPLLMAEDGVLGVFSQAPGAINYGGLGDDGRPKVAPLVTGGRVEIGLDLMERERQIIESGYLMDVFRALVENPQMTATQALELMQERATLMAPIGGRIESEGLGPMTERELEILHHAGQLDPPPREMLETGGSYKIEYTSPMRQAMRASEAIAITRTFEQILPLVEADPSVLDPYDMPAASRELGSINGFPAKLMRSLEDAQARAEGREQQQQIGSVVDAAPAVSAAAANITKMQAAGGRPQL